MKVEVTRYRKADGYATRNWAVVVNGELLAVTVYRKGAEAVARTIVQRQLEKTLATIRIDHRRQLKLATGDN